MEVAWLVWVRVTVMYGSMLGRLLRQRVHCYGDIKGSLVLTLVPLNWVLVRLPCGVHRRAQTPRNQRSRRSVVTAVPLVQEVASLRTAAVVAV